MADYGAGVKTIQKENKRPGFHTGAPVNEIRVASTKPFVKPRKGIPNQNWRKRIVSDPMIVRGKPCIRGTRTPAALVLGYLAAGMDVKEIIRDLPDLTAADVAACLCFARDLADYRLAV